MVEGEKSMTERENILGRIREALRAPAERHGHGVVQDSHSAPHESHASQWLPVVGESFEQRVELFRANAVELKADFHLVDSREAAAEHLRKLAAAKGWKKSRRTRANWPGAFAPVWGWTF